MFCFDSDVLSALARPGGGPPALARRLGVLAADQQCITSITVGELTYGARKRGSTRLEENIDRTISEIEVVPFDGPAARIYAGIRVELEARGQRLDDPDLRIAATCLAHDLTLITGNVRHFERVPGLRVENWLT